MEMVGYDHLMAAVKKDCDEGCGCFCADGCTSKDRVIRDEKGEVKRNCFHAYCDQFAWVINRAKEYGEKLGMPWQEVLNGWEEDRNYWYMNYYQESKQPSIGSQRTRVFETEQDLLDAIGRDGFYCPACGGISSNPYECNSGKIVDGKKCNWKVYGLLGDLGKGTYVYVKKARRGETIFTPVAWTKEAEEP